MGSKEKSHEAGPGVSQNSLYEVSERSDDSTSSVSGTDGGSGMNQHDDLEKESKVLFLSRMAAGAILLLTAATAGITTYFVTSREQLRDFEVQVRFAPYSGRQVRL